MTTTAIGGDPSPRQVLTVAEARAELKVSAATFYRLLEQGMVRSFRIGRLRRIARQDLQDYIDHQRAEAVEEGWA